MFASNIQLHLYVHLCNVQYTVYMLGNEYDFFAHGSGLKYRASTS